MPEKRLKGLISYIGTGHGFKSPADAIAKELEKLGVETVLSDFYPGLGYNKLDKFHKNSWKGWLERPWVYDFIFSITNHRWIKLFERMVFPLLKKGTLAQLEREKPDFILSAYFTGTSYWAWFVNKHKLNIPVFAYNSEVVGSHMTYNSNYVTKYFVATKDCYDVMARQGQSKELLEIASFPIDEKFRKNFNSQTEERKKLGLKDKFTILVMLGGEGVVDIRDLLDKMITSGLDIQLVIVCGKDQNLKQDLDKIKKENPKFDLVAEGFVKNMQDYLYCCDVAAGKSGLNFTFESMFMKKPLIVLRAMANEKPAARLVVKNNIGWWPKTNDEIISIIKDAAETKGYLDGYVNRIKGLDYDFDTSKIAKSIIKLVKNVKG